MPALLSPDAQIVRIATGTPNTPLYAVGPIYMSSTLFYRYSRFAYLYTQAELAAAGIVPGTDILAVGWMKSTPSSTAGPALFNIYMKNTFAAAYADPTDDGPASPSVRSRCIANPHNPSRPPPARTISTSRSTLRSTTSGGSLEIFTEWDISGPALHSQLRVHEWVNTTVVDIYASGNTSLPATLSSTTNNTNIDNRRPVIQFTVQGGTTAIPDLLSTSIGIWPNPADDSAARVNKSGALPRASHHRCARRSF
ncbi:MAG: hypothetical protein IPI07_19555 [Flavobacteriales bacterium]|nr:hypothetical protein [Flavobacteriales bacterium]